MFVIRLPNGNLMVPESAIGEGGRVIGDAYVEIGPGDADYERLAKDALTEEEVQRPGPAGAGLTSRGLILAAASAPAAPP
jgi:hypothetical protein